MSGSLRPLIAPAGAPARLGHRPLPSYRHVPGLTPHPVTHADGHSYGVVEETISLAGLQLPRDWRACDEYLEGIDLFNRAFFWEAHEAWEAAWLAAGTDTVVGRYLQGLIQASAALLKRHVGMQRGALNLLKKSRRNLGPAIDWLRSAGEERFMGIRLDEWQPALEQYVSAGDRRFPFLDPRPLSLARRR